MRFGTPEDPSTVDFTISGRNVVISEATGRPFQAWVGLPKWNRRDIKRFYPPGTGDELAYYSTQFNSIELNATFNRIFPTSQIRDWYDRTPEGFKFFPKIGHEISHVRHLQDSKELVAQTLESWSHFGDKFGSALLQLHDRFGPEEFDRLKQFITDIWDADVPLNIEFRNAAWYEDTEVTDRLCRLMEANKVGHVIIDTAGRRDLLHMRLTTPFAWIRFVGCGVAEIDNKRLGNWATRIAEWKSNGLLGLFFAVHEHDSKNNAALARHFIERLNAATGTRIKVPEIR